MRRSRLKARFQLGDLSQPDEVEELAEPRDAIEDRDRRTSPTDLSQRVTHGLRGRQQVADREDHDSVAQLPQLLIRHWWRLATFRPVEQQRSTLEPARHQFDL